MRGKKTIALIICMVMVFTCIDVKTKAVDYGDLDIVLLSSSDAVITSVTEGDDFKLRIENKSGNTVVINRATFATGSVFSTLTIVPSSTIPPNTLAHGVVDKFSIKYTVNSSVSKGNKAEVIQLTYVVNGSVKTIDIPFSFAKTSEATASNSNGTGGTTDDSTPSYPEGLPSILMLAPLGADGKTVPAPSGDYGDRVTIRIPIFNRGGTGARATRVLVTPVLSATLDSFPFDIEAVDYTRGLEEMRPGETREVQYDLRISKEATSGVKEVKFNAVYFNSQKGAYETATFSVFVNVVKGKTPPKTGAEGEEITTTPKVIIEGYSFKPEKQEDGETLYAGENFELTMRFRNTASETVQNIQITMGNETGTILPANNGSNTLYIEKIGAGEMVERTVSMLTVPEAEPKSHKLSVKFEYESAKTLKSYSVSSDVSLSIKQRIRMRIDDPVIEPEVMMGSTVYAYFNIYNMGNSTVRNLMVDVEGEGLRMEETYYGGNMGSGSSNTVDFGIRAETAGEIKGNVVITYEDAMGEVTRVEKPFTLNVMEAGGGMAIDPETGMPIDPETGKPMDMGGSMEAMGRPGGKGAGLPLWAIIAIAIAGVGLIVGVILFLRKRRRRKVLAGG